MGAWTTKNDRNCYVGRMRTRWSQTQDSWISSVGIPWIAGRPAVATSLFWCSIWYTRALTWPDCCRWCWNFADCMELRLYGSGWAERLTSWREGNPFISTRFSERIDVVSFVSSWSLDLGDLRSPTQMRWEKKSTRYARRTGLKKPNKYTSMMDRWECAQV